MNNGAEEAEIQAVDEKARTAGLLKGERSPSLKMAIEQARAAGHDDNTIITVLLSDPAMDGGRRRRRRHTKKSKKSQRKSKKSQKKNQ